MDEAVAVDDPEREQALESAEEYPDCLCLLDQTSFFMHQMMDGVAQWIHVTHSMQR